ncbi:PAS domain S-box protein [Rhodohalobacter sp.]|uniref:PAS domain-containing sensor histidine kinase n=1 Tax=Rhodohalobacter sp. TaxID=1974210 RepID=UPI002ACD66AA|nr:PAS domain S-box protein [Rhodohalobacter sp.]MDZ7758560.1 PAS domain S-box protein [Rhodohalobacter sp.]
MKDLENAVFNALPGAAAIVAEDGTIISTNSNWANGKESFHKLGMAQPGSNYFDHCQKAVKEGDDYALKIVFGMREVFDGVKSTFELTMPCPDDKQFPKKSWCKLTVSLLDSEENCVLVFFEDVSKNMRVVRALRETQERYTQQFKNSLAGIIISSPEGDIYDANPAACKILGYSKRELIEGGREIVMDWNHPVNQKAHKVREKKSFYEGEKIYKHKDGRELVVESSSVLYKNEDGELRSLNTFRDISKQKETLINLKHEKIFTEAIINSIPGTFYVLNKEMDIVRYNDAFFDDLGYSPEEIESNNALLYFPEDEHEKIINSIEDAFEDGSTHIVSKVISKNDGIRVYHLLANRFTTDKGEFIVGTGTDVTDLVDIEKEKDKNYDMLSQLFESSPLPMAMFSPDNKIVKINNSFTELYGYNKLEAVGKDVHRLLIEGDELGDAQKISEQVFSGQSYTDEVERFTETGEKLTVLMSAIPIIHEKEVVAAYVIYVDLTEQKKMEIDLQKSLGEKEILLQEVHHRVKNNLAVMAGLIDLQIMEEGDAKVQNKLNDIRSRIFSIAKIHENLYSNESMVSIKFDDYLRTIMEALPQKGLTESDELDITVDATPIILNLNQAVPLGLAVNELMNIVFSQHPNGRNLKVLLEKDQNNLVLVFEGDAISTELFERNGEVESFPSLLISIFLSQIHGKMNVSNNGVSRLAIEFEQMDVKGSSSSLTEEQSSIFN